MNLALLLSLIQKGLQVVSAHTSGNTSEIAKLGPDLIEMARAVDTLYKEETGQPINWTNIREHERLN